MSLLSILFGAAWLAGFYALAALGVEPVATFFFLFAWAGLIFTLDRLVARVEGRSLIARCGWGGFAALLLWSHANWCLYELANLRLHNWYYVFVTDRDGLRLAGTVLAFGTVLPGVFWIDHYLGARGVAPCRRWWRLRCSARGLWELQLLGGLCLLLCLADPTSFYPLIWGVTALVVAPINYRNGVDDLLRQWERGDYASTVRLLLAGGIAGGFWELFNFWARGKWIYTVPFFDDLKLFEMPLLGFVGFPPFALECACLYRLLVWYRLAPPVGAFAQQGPERTWATRLVAWAAAAAVGLLGYAGVDRVTVTSRTPRVEDAAALTGTQRAALIESGAAHLTDLSGWGSARRWERVEAALGDSQAARVRDTVALYLHQGIGTEFGNRLAAAGFGSLQDLQGLTAAQVRQRLIEAAGPGRVPSQAQVEVWLRRLPAPAGGWPQP